MELKLEEKRELAEKWVKSLKKLSELDMYILLRTTGEFVGIVFYIERRPVNGAFRTVLHYITPDGRIAKEYLDYMPDPNGEPQDVRVIIFSRLIILTARKKPGFEDSEENFEWIISMDRANYYMNLRDDNIRKRQEIAELMWRMDEMNATISRQDNEVTVLSERLRMTEEKEKMLSRENILLKRTVSQLEEVAKKAMAGYIEAEAALSEIMRKAEILGQDRVLSPSERVKEIAKEGKDVMEIIQSTYSPIEGDNTAILAKLDYITNRIQRLEEDIRKVRREEVKEKTS